MKFSLGIPMMHPDGTSAFLSAESIAELAVAAERAGWDAIYLTEHPIPGDKWLTAGGHHAPDPFVGLAFAAAATTRLRILTNLTVVPYRNPFLLAKTAATLDRLSGGRLTLGVGTGYLKAEFFALGVDFEERNALFDESIEVLRAVWSGASVDYEGRHFSARGVSAMPTPAQDPLPIWIGGNSKLTRRRVAQRAQGWMPMPNTAATAKSRRSPVLETLEELDEMLRYMREEADQAGRTEPLDVMYMCLDGGLPEDDDFDLARHVDALGAQQQLGVTWSAVNGADGDASRTIETMERYAVDVIAKLR